MVARELILTVNSLPVVVMISLSSVSERFARHNGLFRVVFFRSSNAYDQTYDLQGQCAWPSKRDDHTFAGHVRPRENSLGPTKV